jgi:hypothetical protein
VSTVNRDSELGAVELDCILVRYESTR